MKYVLFYEADPNVLPKAPSLFPEHKAHYEQFVARGELLMIGIFTNAVEDGAMAIFTTREAAEQFAAADPFVLNGVVAKWRISEWREALTG